MGKGWASRLLEAAKQVTGSSNDLFWIIFASLASKVAKSSKTLFLHSGNH
ncbi:hypothetical protein [Metabacillus sp. 84]